MRLQKEEILNDFQEKIRKKLQAEPAQPSPNEEHGSSQPSPSTNLSKGNADGSQNLSEDWDAYDGEEDNKLPTNQDFLSSVQNDIKPIILNV